jgi:hypothetical protein
MHVWRCRNFVEEITNENDARHKQKLLLDDCSSLTSSASLSPEEDIKGFLRGGEGGVDDEAGSEVGAEEEASAGAMLRMG